MSTTEFTDAEMSPYPGARPFTEGDRRLFYGRVSEIQQVARSWRQNRITVLYGASGVGKTSLIQAGVIPSVASEEANLLPLGRVSRGSAFPAAALSEQNPYTLGLLSSWSPLESLPRLSGLSIETFLRRRERTDRHGMSLPTMVAIDQVEQLFRPADARVRNDFLGQLAEALVRRPEARLLMVVRGDRADALRIVDEMRVDLSVQLELLPLDRPCAIEAVIRPLGEGGSFFAPGVAAKIITELLGEDDADAIAPVLLQVLCHRLWKGLAGKASVITEQMLPDIGETVREFCSHLLVSVAADQQRRPAELVAWLCEAFLTSAEGGAEVVEGAIRAGGMPGSVLHAVEDQHLIKSRWRDGARWYGLRDPLLSRAIRQLRSARWPLSPPDPAAHLRSAESAWARGDADLARRHATEAVTTCRSGDIRIRAEAESIIGNVAYAEGDTKDAIDHYATAANLFEALQDTVAVGRLLAALGRLQLAQGQRADAVGKLEAAVGRIPNDPTVQTALAQALWDAGQTKSALAILGDVLRRDGDISEALRARGEIFADLGDSVSALRDLDRVDRRGHPSARAARALALARLADADAARAELGDAIGEATNSGPILLRAARVQSLSGNTDSAAELAARALAADNPPLPPHQHSAATRVSHEV